MAEKIEPKYHLPFERNDDMYAQVNQPLLNDRSFGVKSAICKKLNHPDMMGTEHQPDPFLEKALMLTAIYDNNNIDALMKNRNTILQPEFTVLPHNSSDTLQHNVVPRSTTPPSSRIIGRNDPNCSCNLSDTVQDNVVPRSTTSPTSRIIGKNDSNCMCKQRLDILHRMQNALSSNNMSCFSTNIDLNMSSGCTLEAPLRDALSNEDNIHTKRVHKENDPEKEHSYNYEKFGLGDLGNTQNIDRCKINPKNRNMGINKTSVMSMKPTTKHLEKRSHDYLPLENKHLEAILGHGEAFGLKFPLQTKLNSTQSTSEASSIKMQIKESTSKSMNLHRLFANRPQTRDIENGNRRKAETAHSFTRSHQKNMSNSEDTVPRSRVYSPLSMSQNYMTSETRTNTPTEVLKNQMQQHPQGIYPKNQVNSINDTNGTEDVYSLLSLECTSHNANFVANTHLSNFPNSIDISDLLKSTADKDALHTLLSLSATLQNQKNNKVDLKPSSVTSMDMQTQNKKRRYPWS